MKINEKEYEGFFDFFVGGGVLDVGTWVNDNGKTMNDNGDVECGVLSDDVVDAMLSKVMVK